jgi:hypothetical protein
VRLEERLAIVRAVVEAAPSPVSVPSSLRRPSTRRLGWRTKVKRFERPVVDVVTSVDAEGAFEPAAIESQP